MQACHEADLDVPPAQEPAANFGATAVTVTRDTRIVVADDQGSFGDLREGTLVKVAYEAAPRQTAVSPGGAASVTPAASAVPAPPPQPPAASQRRPVDWLRNEGRSRP